jgi:hypothetical protein
MALLAEDGERLLSDTKAPLCSRRLLEPKSIATRKDSTSSEGSVACLETRAGEAELAVLGQHEDLSVVARVQRPGIPFHLTGKAHHGVDLLRHRVVVIQRDPAVPRRSRGVEVVRRPEDRVMGSCTSPPKS